MHSLLARLALTFLVLVFALPGAARAVDLVMVERAGCHWCERWNAEIAHIYPKTREGKLAPLRRADIHDLPDDVTFKSPPIFTPTFVLVKDGVELGRIEGYASEDFFWFHVEQLLAAHQDAFGEPAKP